MSNEIRERSHMLLAATLLGGFSLQDFVTQREALDELEEDEALDPGFRVWLRDEVLAILRDDSMSVEERLLNWTGNAFDGGPQIAWDFWAYVWETVTNGEPWPADLPPANADTFASLREEYNEADDD